MEPSQTFKLVEGTFSPPEAADVLFSLIANKIKFHQVQLLGIKEEIDDQELFSEQRIQSLRDSKNMVKDVILNARDKGFQLQIDGDIRIKLVPMTQTV